MARRSAFSISIDVDQITNLARRLAGVTPEKMSSFLIDALNETADSAYDLGRQRILSGINLTDEYVQRKMGVEHATAGKLEATITAYGGKGFTTSLSHYGALQLAEAVNWSNARIAAAGHRFGQWPGWTRRTGSNALGIAVDTKSAGRSVEVVKGARKKIGHGFAIPGKKDGDGHLVVFSRKADGKLKALSGPSVYQLFRVAAGHIEHQVAGDLERAVITTAERRLREALT
jgi:hypothetical protein